MSAVEAFPAFPALSSRAMNDGVPSTSGAMPWVSRVCSILVWAGIAVLPVQVTADQNPGEQVEWVVHLGFYNGAVYFKLDIASAQFPTEVNTSHLSAESVHRIQTECTSGNLILTIGGCRARIRGHVSSREVGRSEIMGDGVFKADDVQVLGPAG